MAASRGGDPRARAKADGLPVRPPATSRSAGSAVAGLLSVLGFGALFAQSPKSDFEAMPFAPRRYVTYRAPAPISVDGRLDERAWTSAAWTDFFIDIDGDRRPQPRFRTRAKMLWDDEYFYVAAEMEEPDLWGTLTVRDSVIFQDNDFELFIDPDGDTHAYYELEVNVLATAWDLMLVKPYRDGGPALNGWDIAGLRVGVDTRGTVNRPGDRDDGWTVEIAMPWKILREAARDHKRPEAGDQWRINFSRVQWHLDDGNGSYAKRLKPGTTTPLPEDNWVWSPQGAIDMHMPERWGYVQFSSRLAGSGTDAFVEDPNESVKWGLRRLYYRQRAMRAATGRYAETLEALNDGRVSIDVPDSPVLQTTRSLYEISAKGSGGTLVHINQDGRVWVTR